MMRSNYRKNYYGYLFIAPFIIGFLVFGLYPLYNTIALSFTNTTMMKANGTFVGLQNFERLFADKTFFTAITNTWSLWLMAVKNVLSANRLKYSAAIAEGMSRFGI